MKTITDYRKESTLNQVLRYPEGIMTRKEWLKIQFSKGAYVAIGTKTVNRFNRIKYNRLTGAEQAEYERKCNETMPCYELKYPNENSFYEITKTEYEFFLDLQLSQDLNTEKCEIGEKIEAGMATEAEINEYMQKDFDFINKYYGKR